MLVIGLINREYYTGDEDLTNSRVIMALIGKVEEFFPDQEGWDQYIERLEHYFSANGITDSGKQRAILLTVIGAKAYSLFAKSRVAGETRRQVVRRTLCFDETPLQPGPE